MASKWEVLYEGKAPVAMSHIVVNSNSCGRNDVPVGSSGPAHSGRDRAREVTPVVRRHRGDTRLAGLMKGRTNRSRGKYRGVTSHQGLHPATCNLIVTKGGGPGGGGGDLVPTMPGCVCPKVKDMGSFSASSQ